MTSMCLFSILLIVLFLYSRQVENASLIKAKAGPFKVTLQSIRRCKKYKVAYENDPSALLHLETYNDTNGINLVRGNFTIFKDTSNWKATAKQFVWVNGKWKSSIVLHSSGCQGIFITILVSMMGVDYDYDRCSIRLGTYVIKELDGNKLAHVWTPTQIYGKEMWRTVVTSPAGLVDCWEFLDVIEPL